MGKLLLEELAAVALYVPVLWHSGLKLCVHWSALTLATSLFCVEQRPTPGFLAICMRLILLDMA